MDTTFLWEYKLDTKHFLNKFLKSRKLFKHSSHSVRTLLNNSWPKILTARNLQASPYHLKFIALSDKNHMVTHTFSWEAKAQYLQAGKYTWSSCHFLSGRSALTHFLVWFEEFYKVLGIKYRTKSLSHARHFSTTKLSLQTEFRQFNDNMRCTRVDLLSYWKRTTKILRVSKGIFMEQNLPDQIIIHHTH